MATIYDQEVLRELSPEVISVYKDLMEASTAQNSVYLKAKETLVQILTDANITGDEKGKIIAQTISAMVNGITAQSMDTALKIAKFERDDPYNLTRVKEETKAVTASVAKVEQDIENAKADNRLKVFQGWQIQGTIKRDLGIDAHDLSDETIMVPATEYHDEGIKYETIRQAQANTYGAYAGAYRTHGYVALNLNEDGTLASSTTGTVDGLTYWQTRVAERQEQGFDDNMRQHVVNSSATMISMLLSTEASGINYTPYLNKWTAAIDYLNTSDNGVI